MIDVVILIIVLLLVLFALRYIIKAKKSGQACIGCPNSSGCSGHCHCKEEK